MREARFDTPEFRTLLGTLNTIVHDQTHHDVDDQWPHAVVHGATMLYDGCVFWSRFPGLHDLAEPLSRVIDILRKDELREGVLILLGAKRQLVVAEDHPEDTEDIGPIVAQYQRLLSDLEQMKATLPKVPTPPKRGKGNPREAMDLFHVVYWMAKQWEEVIGKKTFKVMWQGSEPVTPATRFVHEIVKFIAPARVSELQTVTRKVRRRISEDKEFAT
jgi:hypothetical protein